MSKDNLNIVEIKNEIIDISLNDFIEESQTLNKKKIIRNK